MFYNEFEVYNAYIKSGKPTFPWLPELDKWLTERYDVRFTPVFYDDKDLAERGIHCFKIVPYSWEEFKKLMNWESGDGNLLYETYVRESEINDEIKRLAEMHGTPVINDTQKIVVVIEQAYLVTYRCQYLLWKKSLQHENEIESLFTYLKPYELSVGAAPYTCILKTRKRAREFYNSSRYGEIAMEIFNLLKPYDEFDILKPEDIHIFVDYMGHYENTPMHGRWVRDMNYSDMEEYMRSL